MNLLQLIVDTEMWLYIYIGLYPSNCIIIDEYEVIDKTTFQVSTETRHTCFNSKKSRMVVFTLLFMCKINKLFKSKTHLKFSYNQN